MIDPYKRGALVISNQDPERSADWIGRSLLNSPQEDRNLRGPPPQTGRTMAVQSPLKRKEVGSFPTRSTRRDASGEAAGLSNR